MLNYLASEEIHKYCIDVNVGYRQTRLMARQSGSNSLLKFKRLFTSTEHSDWIRDQPSLIFHWYQVFFV